MLISILWFWFSGFFWEIEELKVATDQQPTSLYIEAFESGEFRVRYSYLFAEMGKVTLKSNSDEALSDESL
jgi:hypothetical protein